MEHGGDGFPGGGFHRNEAISAVQDDEQYYGEDDDFDDLYNDVNVGEVFHQTLQRSGESGGFQAREDRRSEPLQPSVPPPPAAAQPVVDQPERIQIPGIAGETRIERPSERSVGFQDDGFRGAGEAVAGIREAPPPPQPSAVGGGVRPEIRQASGLPVSQMQGPNDNNSLPNEGFQKQGGGFGNEGLQRQGGVGAGRPGPIGNDNGGGDGGGVAGTTLFVGELHWWTTDAELEAELCKYGQVKEIKFFDEKASGKSKGYCQVDFYDPMAAASCKDGMNGHVFNGRPCVVALTSPYTVRRMGENQVSKHQQAMAQSQPPALAQKGRGGGGYQMGGNFGRGGGGGGGGGNWGRGGGMGNRGPMGNMRNRMGPGGGRGMVGNGGIFPPPPPVLPPGAMLGQGFDPTGYGAAMGRMAAGYGCFPAGPAGAAFPGMMPSFPQVVAPHVNPAFFGRGMTPAGVGMWPDPSMGGWGGEEQASYGEDAVSDHYGEANHGKERVPDRDRSGASERQHEREKDMGPGQELAERRHHDERDIRRDREMARERDREWERERERERDRERERERERGNERDRYRDDRERHGDHYRHRDREPEREDDWDRGRPSRPSSRSRDIEHGKRRRLSPE